MAEKHDDTVDERDEKEEELEDLEDDLGEEEDGEKGEDDDDNGDRPVTAKDLKKFGETINQELNKRFAGRRHQTKNKGDRPYQPSQKEDDKDENAGRLDRLEIANRKRDFGFEHNLSPKETDLVFRFDKNPSAKTLKDPFVMGGLKQMRNQRDVEENTPNGSAAATFEVDGKKWDDMTPAEKQKNFPARQRAIIAAKRK